MSIRVAAIAGTAFVSGLPLYAAFERYLSRMVVCDDANKLHLHWNLFQSRKVYVFSQLNPERVLRSRLLQCTSTRI